MGLYRLSINNPVINIPILSVFQINFSAVSKFAESVHHCFHEALFVFMF